MRACGVLLHITSLPSPYGIGTLGKDAYQFIDFLKAAGHSYWQILPIGPTTIGDSPYQSFSAFAGNPLLIDLDLLAERCLLNREEMEQVLGDSNKDSVDYKMQFEEKYMLFRKAFERFQNSPKNSIFEEFCNQNQDWLEDYSLYMALKYHFSQKSWNEWEEDIKQRKQDAVLHYRTELKEELEYWKFIQYLFFEQWEALQDYAHENGIKIVGDIPIYVAYDSADVWADPQLFLLDEEGNPKMVAGCPPDDTFSKTGQLWGNPLYRWSFMKKTKYHWWIRRIRHSLKLFDTLRIDHFRGFDSYYGVPYEDKTAEWGKWITGPGKDFFREVKRALGEISIIAENLGFITESVNELLAFTEYPGMNVMEYAFSEEKESEDMPHNFTPHSVTYLGTHDNDTCRGYLESLDQKTLSFIKKYIGVEEEKDCIWGMIRAAYASVSQLVIIQMQDFLNIDSQGRMNYPSKTDGNWKWRMKEDYIGEEMTQRMKEMAKTYFRHSINM